MTSVRKIITSAAVLAVSMMTVASANVLAQDNDIVLSVLDVNGNMVGYTEADINAMDGIIPAYGGITVEVVDRSEATLMRAGFTGSLSTRVPGTSGMYNIYDASYTAEIDMPDGATRYTGRRMKMDSSNASTATILYEIIAGTDDEYDEFDNDLYGDFYIPELNGSSPVSTIYVDFNRTLVLSNVDTDYTCYASVTNETGDTAYGSLSISAF